MRIVYVYLQLNAMEVGIKAAKRTEKNRGFASAQIRIISGLRELNSMYAFPLRDAIVRSEAAFPATQKEWKVSP